MIKILFRIFNLIVYAAFFSSLGVFYMLDSLDGTLSKWIGPNILTPTGYLILAAFLLGNMIFILIFKKIASGRKNVEFLYYLCDAVIRVTFTVPVCYVIYYYAISRFFPIEQVLLGDLILAVLFFVWDYLMRWQLRYQLHANFYATNNHL